MTVTLITNVKPTIDEPAARALALQALASKPPGPPYVPAALQELQGGLDDFINGVVQLFSTTQDYVADLEASKVFFFGIPVWVCEYGDGRGDGPDWTANAGWYESEAPGLFAALGIHVSQSNNIYGNGVGWERP